MKFCQGNYEKPGKIYTYIARFLVMKIQKSSLLIFEIFVYGKYEIGIFNKKGECVTDILFHIPIVRMMNQSFWLWAAAAVVFPKPKTEMFNCPQTFFVLISSTFHATNNVTFHTTKENLVSYDTDYSNTITYLNLQT